MTNQLVEDSSTKKSFRGEEVFVSTTEEFDKISTHHKIRYFCKNCNKETTVIKDSRYAFRQRNLLCRDCNLKLSCSRKNGYDKIADPDEYIKVTSVEQLKNIKNGRNIQYNCINCGKDFKMRIKSDRRKRCYTLLCSLCSLNSKYINRKAYRGQRRYTYNNELFDSSWELAFYIFHKDNGSNIIHEPIPIEFEFKGEIHIYYPDFEVDGQLYELKGDQFLGDNNTFICPYNRANDELYEEKHQVGIKNNVIFIFKKDIKKYIDYVNIKYGKDYLQTFRNKENKRIIK